MRTEEMEKDIGKVLSGLAAPVASLPPGRELRIREDEIVARRDGEERPFDDLDAAVDWLLEGVA